MKFLAHKAQAKSSATIKTLNSAEHRILTAIGGMASGDQKQTKRTDAPQETSETRPASNMKERGETIKEDLDRIIDEIDEVLEENAEEFVKNYVQRGGE
jgi:ubiquitin-like protein Pup